MRLNAMWNAMGVPLMYRQQMQNLRLTSSQTFLLVRLVGNLKGSQVSLFSQHCWCYFYTLLSLNMCFGFRCIHPPLYFFD